jgi:hypothetical protein
MLQYNLSTTGGTSGSPVFVPSGAVVGINNSGMYQVIRDYYGQYVRVPVGALNFGVRIDYDTAVLDLPYQVAVADFRLADPDPAQTLQAGEYRITLDWNSTIDFDLWAVIGSTQYTNGFLDTSRAHIYPFTVHHGDTSSDGPEQITVTRLVEDIIIFAERWTDSGSFAGSQAECQIIDANGVVGEVLTPPVGDEAFWIIGTLDAQGQFQVTNELSNLNSWTSSSTTTVLKKQPVDASEGTILKAK